MFTGAERNDREHSPAAEENASGLAMRMAIITMLLGAAVGCGTTKTQEATEQLTLSSAVDNSIAAIDFRPLTGQKVYFDDTYIKNHKTPSVVNADYVISSLRQQIMAAGCLLQEKIETADIVIEGRVGTLGADDHRITYGLPENNVIGAAATFISPVPTGATTMPEIAIARRDAREGAAKVAAFAYHRESREPLWQSGISKSIATSQNTWVLGVGPFQGGSIRDSSKVARKEGKAGAEYVRNGKDVNQRPPVSYSAEMRYEDGWPLNGRPRPASWPPSSPTMVATNPDGPAPNADAPAPPPTDAPVPPDAPVPADAQAPIDGSTPANWSIDGGIGAAITGGPTAENYGLMGGLIGNGVVEQPPPPSLQR